MFLAIFSILLLTGNIYFFIKKKYLYLFIPCMLFLPEYYGVEFSALLPVLTVTRMMYIFFYIYALINRKRNISLKNFSIKNLPREWLFLLGYFVLRLIANLYYAPVNGSAIKTIFEIIFEQILLLIAIYILEPTNEEIFNTVKATVYGASVLFIVGSFETLTFIRPFDNLYTVNRTMINEHFIRFNFLRATTTLGMPVFYGNFCLLMFTLILYLYETTKYKRYIIIATLDMLAIVHSGCRSSIIFLLPIVFIYFVFILRDKTRRLQFLKHATACILALVIFVGAISACNEYFRYFYTSSAKSVLNEFGFEFDLEADSPEYATSGVHATGGHTRKMQISGIEYTMSTSPIFGLGSGAEDRSEVHYRHNNGRWYPDKTIDIGYVEVIIIEGIIGGISYILLILFILAIIKASDVSKIYEKRVLYLTVFTYFMCMLTTANMYNFLYFFIIIYISTYFNNPNAKSS